MKLKLIFKVIFCLSSVTVFAQMGNLSDIGLAGKPLMIDAETKYSGTPYLETSWHNGNIKLNNEYVFESVKIRYNVFQDVPEFNKDGQAMSLDPLKVREFTYQTYNGAPKNYVFKNGFTVPGFTPKNYFEVLYGGNIYLLKKHIKEIVNDPNATYGSVASKVISDRKELCYVIGENNSGLLKANKKSVLALFPGKEKQIEEYVKANKLIYKFEEDLAKIFAFVDTL